MFVRSGEALHLLLVLMILCIYAKPQGVHINNDSVSVLQECQVLMTVRGKTGLFMNTSIKGVLFEGNLQCININNNCAAYNNDHR